MVVLRTRQAPAVTLRLSRVGGNKAMGLAQESGHEAFSIAICRTHACMRAEERGTKCVRSMEG